MSNLISWLILIITTISMLLLTYYLNLTPSLNILVWIGWLMLSSLFFYFTTQGKSFIAFVNEAKIELMKVIWPTRQETIQITIIVMVVVAVTGLILWGIDSGIMWMIGKITRLG